jgi:hypothetical protein
MCPDEASPEMKQAADGHGAGHSGHEQLHSQSKHCKPDKLLLSHVMESLVRMQDVKLHPPMHQIGD